MSSFRNLLTINNTVNSSNRHLSALKYRQMNDLDLRRLPTKFMHRVHNILTKRPPFYFEYSRIAFCSILRNIKAEMHYPKRIQTDCFGIDENMIMFNTSAVLPIKANKSQGVFEINSCKDILPDCKPQLHVLHHE